MSTMDFALIRNKMVKTQIQSRGVNNPKVLEAMNTVPRHLFVPPSIVQHSYDDSPFPIGSDQTISQPYIVALMAEAAQIEEKDNILEVGGGCGYAAAVYSHLGAKVYTTEIIKKLGEFAKENLLRAGYNSVTVEITDGSIGLPEHAPFNAILVAAAAPNVPPSLLQQLANNGRLIIPVHFEENAQKLMRITKLNENEIKEEVLEFVRFVPLRGAEGFN